MEKASLKFASLVVLLVIASGLSSRSEARELMQKQCDVPSDCPKFCRGCIASKCTGGLCVCGCARRSESAADAIFPVDCIRNEDCYGVPYTHDCSLEFRRCARGKCGCLIDN